MRRSRFKAHPIGFPHIDIAELHTEEGRLDLVLAVDRTSNFAFAGRHARATRGIAASFPDAPVAALPCRIHTVLTETGTQPVDRTPSNEETEADAYWATRHASGSSVPSARPASRTGSSTTPRSLHTGGRMMTDDQGEGDPHPRGRHRSPIPPRPP